MSFTLSVEGTFNFTLENREITGFGFKYGVENSKYAKGPDDMRLLTINGDITRTLENDPEAMAQIREWSKRRYKDPSYYHKVKVEYIYRDEVLRSYLFTACSIEKYDEQIDPHSGRGTYTLVVAQRADLRHEVSIDGRGPRMTLSQMWAEREEVRAEKALVVAPIQEIVNAENIQNELNSPYWIARNQVIHEHIRIVRLSRASYTPGGRHVHSFEPGTMGKITSVRLYNGVVYLRFNEIQGPNLWIRHQDNIEEVGRTTDRGTRMFVIPTAENGITRILGFGNPAIPSDQQPEMRPLTPADFINAGNRHNFDGSGGVIEINNNLAGLKLGSVVIVAGREESINTGVTFIEIIKWGNETIRYEPELYLAFGGQRITNNSNEGFFRLYRSPTLPMSDNVDKKPLLAQWA